ncbi:MAG: transglycosylase domain-containing protein [Balneolaceae bacterium]|nr:transglycosylase domain-containing protein [Balneolaceae bacterium]
MSKTKKRIIIGFCALPLVLGIIFISMVYGGYFGPVPGTDELSSIQNYEASQVFSSDGKLLGTYYLQNRTEVSLEEINPLMTRALIAVEDARFYEHNGIDERALARVLFKTILLGQDTGGGSTLTQQLAKNLYPRDETGWFHLVGDKFREMIIARRLERVYSKEKILSLYLNSVSFGEEIYGVEMAALRFFDKDASDLNLQEAATLTGMLKGTSWYNPKNHPERAKERRNVVLNQMVRYGNLSSEVADSVMVLPMQLNYTRITSNEGPAPYFREHIRQEVSRILESRTGSDGKKYNLYTDGLEIQTTVDSRVQLAAEKAVDAQMKELQNFLNRQIERSPIFADRNDSTIHYAWRQTDQYEQLKNAGRTDTEIDNVLHTPRQMELFTWYGYEQRSVAPYDSLKHYLSFLNSGFLAMKPQNGHVVAWVGGINHKHFKYDHVKSKRQVGSAFKPIVYAAALESGMRPCDYRRNILTTYEEYEEWTPRNHADEYGGRYSISAALANSYNTIAVDLLMDTGIPEVQSTAQKMGIQSYIPSEPSIALGTAEVSLMELVTSYTSFLNEGRPATPILITSIKNAQGEVIYQPENETAGYNEQVASAMDDNSLSPRTAATMVRMLEKVVNEGTGYRLRSRFGIDHALAGKTGTTQNYTDGWFVGMTPEMVFGTWVGGWNYRVRFDGSMGYATQTALPIVGRFLQNIQDYPELEQADRFYSNQTSLSYRLNCPDFRPDKLSDRLKDFFQGRDDDEPVVKDDEEKKSIFGRIRSIFTKDDDESNSDN